MTVEKPVFIDTNVLLYARDLRDPAKRAIAVAWLRHLAATGQGRISTQVLVEFYAAATHPQKLALPTAQARAGVEALSHWRPVASDLTLWREAWCLADSHSLSWWDSMILAAARQAGCRAILSEDLQDGLLVDGVLAVVNPFTPAAPSPPGVTPAPQPR
ncbi:MAG: PIN domain-containing protein [Bifidobacteriaceae bacterium]|jgi:predicted nucleic acid-binding protein|nr:PIN domain-containing protein [Bifidobacteriaceae bacterium]